MSVFPVLIPAVEESHTIPFRIGPHVGPPRSSHRTICKSVEAAMHQQPPRLIIMYHTWRPVMRVLPAEWLLHRPWLCWFILYVAQAESGAERLLSRSCSCRNTFTPDTGGASQLMECLPARGPKARRYPGSCSIAVPLVRMIEGGNANSRPSAVDLVDYGHAMLSVQPFAIDTLTPLVR